MEEFSVFLIFTFHKDIAEADRKHCEYGKNMCTGIQNSLVVLFTIYEP